MSSGDVPVSLVNDGPGGGTCDIDALNLGNHPNTRELLLECSILTGLICDQSVDSEVIFARSHYERACLALRQAHTYIVNRIGQLSKNEDDSIAWVTAFLVIYLHQALSQAASAFGTIIVNSYTKGDENVENQYYALCKSVDKSVKKYLDRAGLSITSDMAKAVAGCLFSKTSNDNMFITNGVFVNKESLLALLPITESLVALNNYRIKSDRNDDRSSNYHHADDDANTWNITLTKVKAVNALWEEVKDKTSTTTALQHRKKGESSIRETFKRIIGSKLWSPKSPSSKTLESKKP